MLPRFTAGSRINVQSKDIESVAGFGDSITVGNGASSPEKSWMGQLGARRFFPVLNQGIGATILQNGNSESGSPFAGNGMDRYVADLLGVNRRNWCVVAYGHNDARHIGAPATLNLANYKTAMDTLLAALKTGGYAAQKIIVVTPYWVTDYCLAHVGPSGRTGQSRSNFLQFVDAALAAAATAGTKSYDAYRGMAAHGGDTLISDTDFIHPNDPGYDVISAGILALT